MRDKIEVRAVSSGREEGFMTKCLIFMTLFLSQLAQLIEVVAAAVGSGRVEQVGIKITNIFMFLLCLRMFKTFCFSVFFFFSFQKDRNQTKKACNEITESKDLR